MRTLRTIAELNAALAQPRRDGRRIGLVPTMGAFHEGHLSLMREARSECDVVVVSLFVNPTQFNDGDDLSAYPRDEERDSLLASAERVDLLFAPPVEEIYPDGFATTVSVGGITEVLEGVHRGRGHFDGVTTVVTKLFTIVTPDFAYFGQKDAQQALVIRRLVRDLNLPVRIEVCPIVREADGLAMSSRNLRLTPDERRRATALSRSLQVAAALVAGGETEAPVIVKAARAELASSRLDTEYFEIVDPETLLPIQTVDGPALALVAARVGSTRLIDNQTLPTTTGIARPRSAQAAGSI